MPYTPSFQDTLLIADLANDIPFRLLANSAGLIITQNKKYPCHHKRQTDNHRIDDALFNSKLISIVVQKINKKHHADSDGRK